MRLRPSIAVLVLLAGPGEVAVRPQSTAAPNARQSDSVATTAILVDVVVRDRDGRPVADLAAADFELYEDGVRQTVDTFTRVARGGGIGVGIGWKVPATSVTTRSARGEVKNVDTAAEPGATAIVFDHLTSESLGLAQRATLAYLPGNGEAGTSIGVFATDPGMPVLQAYTTDLARIRKAIAAVMPTGDSSHELRAQRGDELADRRRQLRSDTESASAGVLAGSGEQLASNAAALGTKENELKLVQTELNMIRSLENLDRDQRGYDTSLSLLRIVRSLADYPGRKNIVFFSEGLPVSPSLSARLDAVIEAAGRANVTAYAINATGLRPIGATANLLKQLATHADERLAQVSSGSSRTDEPMAIAFERIEDTMKLDSRTGLARLAQDTGGFLVEESNDLAAAFRRIDEDNRFHYLLTYSPRNTVFDGKFRTIRVKVGRARAQVFARRGYRAVRSTLDANAVDYAASAIALLNRTPLPNAFPVRAAGFSFPDPARPGLTPLLVDVATHTLRFVIDAERATYSAQAVILVRLRDARGQEVQKLSQQYVLAGDAADVEAARNGTILFYREPDLTPGIYTMETVVLDANANSGSVRIATLTVPPVERTRLGMSSLILVKKVEEVAAGADPSAAAAPLYVGNRLLYPNLGEPLRKAAASELPFFFTLYGNVQQVQASAQLLRNGQAVAEAPMEIPTASGPRLQHVGSLPIAGLPAGTYELRIRVSDGRQELSRTAFFTIE